MKTSSIYRGYRWFLDEMVVSTGGKRRSTVSVAVDQDGDMLDILVIHPKNEIVLTQRFAYIGDAIHLRRET